MRGRRTGTVLGVTALLVLWGSTAAFASKTGPCDGSVTIDGVRYDSTNDTADDPIVVPADKGGVTASWEGTTGTPITNHSGSVSVVVGPIPIEIASWAGTNSDMEVSASGTYDLADIPDFVKSLTGLYEVHAEHSGDGGTCEGTVMVKLDGNGLTSPVGAVSAAGAVLMAAGLFFAGRGRA